LTETYLKLLVPSYAAGGIIGRGGEKIGQMQKDLNVRMKISKANEHYPGTSERVCLIFGSLKSIIEVHEFIMKKVKEKSDAKPADDERLNQVHLLQWTWSC
jgi:RNA-binding protein Nova